MKRIISVQSLTINFIVPKLEAQIFLEDQSNIYKIYNVYKEIVKRLLQDNTQTH